MKKVLFFAALLGFAVACGGGDKKSEEAKNEEAQVEATEETPADEDVAEVIVPESKEADNKPVTAIGTATEFKKESNIKVSDEKLSVGAAAAVNETRADGQPANTHSASEFKKESNIKVGGSLNTSVQVVK